jgi:hypothetical protein
MGWNCLRALAPIPIAPAIGAMSAYSSTVFRQCFIYGWAEAIDHGVV